MPLALVALFSTVGSIRADGPLKLGLTTLGTTGSNFVLTMQPGESRNLAVKLDNYGAESVQVRTYAADAFSMINGGLAVRLVGEPSSGTTDWLTYSAEDLDLAARTAVERDFTVTVPVGTPPGEYQTSLVLQNATPVSTSNAPQTGMMLQQIIRQVVVVSVDVPGPRTPSLELGPTTHSLVVQHSRLTVGVANLGNVRLKPTGEFVLWDSAGSEVTRYPVAMDTVYAHTDTVAAIPFAQRLNPGDYTAKLTLTDTTGFSVTSSIMPFTIPDAVLDTPPPSTDLASSQAEANQTPVGHGIPVAPSSPWIIAMIAFGAGLGLMLAVFGVGFVIYRRRRRDA